MLYNFHRHSMHFGQFDVGFVPGVLPLPLPCSRFCSSSSCSPCHALPYPNTRFTRRRNKTRNGEKTREIRSLSTSTNTQCHAHAHTHTHMTHTHSHTWHTHSLAVSTCRTRVSLCIFGKIRANANTNAAQRPPPDPLVPPIPLELRCCPLWCSVVQCAYCRR